MPANVFEVHREASITGTIVPEVHHDVPNIRPITKIRSDVENTRTIVSNVHQNNMKSPKYMGDRNQLVSATRFTLIIRE